MNQRADGHAQQNVREHLFEGGNHLIPGIEQAFLLRQRRRLDVHRAGIADEGFHLLFHVQALNQRAAGDGDDQAQYHMGEEIRKENVTPSGSPALVKPMNSGIDEQEQNGVTVPSSAATQLAHSP